MAEVVGCEEAGVLCADIRLDSLNAFGWAGCGGGGTCELDGVADDLEKIDDFLSDDDFFVSPPPKLKFDSRNVSEFRAVSPLPDDEVDSFVSDLDVFDLLELLLRSRDLSGLLDVDRCLVFGVLWPADGSVFVVG